MFLATIASNTPDPVAFVVGTGVDHPLAVGRLGRVFRVDPVLGQLSRATAVSASRPDFEVPASVAAPQNRPAIGGEGRIPVVGPVVGELTDLARVGAQRPDVQVAAAIRGEDQGGAVGSRPVDDRGSAPW